MYTLVVAFSTAPTSRSRIAAHELAEAIRIAWAMGATAVQAELDDVGLQ